MEPTIDLWAITPIPITTLLDESGRYTFNVAVKLGGSVSFCFGKVLNDEAIIT